MPLSYIKASSISLNNPDIKHMLPYISLYISCPQYHLEAKYITVDLVSCCWEGQMVVSATNTNIYLPGSAMRPASGRSDINKSRWVGGGEVQWFQWLGLAVCYHLHSLSNQSRVNQTCYVTYADVITVFFLKEKNENCCWVDRSRWLYHATAKWLPFTAFLWNGDLKLSFKSLGVRWKKTLLNIFCTLGNHSVKSCPGTENCWWWSGAMLFEVSGSYCHSGSFSCSICLRGRTFSSPLEIITTGLIQSITQRKCLCYNTSHTVSKDNQKSLEVGIVPLCTQGEG